jgi:hypothetical protein
MRLLILSVVLAAVASAQSHTDFSGTWKQDNSRSTLRPGSTIQYSNKVEVRDQKLTVTTIRALTRTGRSPHIAVNT